MHYNVNDVNKCLNDRWKKILNNKNNKHSICIAP